MYFVKTPWLLKTIYPELIWNQSRMEKTLYLTFDDGPIPELTPWVLEQLAAVEAKATFFCIGDNIHKHPAIFQQVKDAGHRIGNHSYHHLNGWKSTHKAYLDDIAACQDLMPETNLFRPPYGRIRKKQIAALSPQHRIIMWDVLTGDFDKSISPINCLNNTLSAAENGSIIVFHDSLKAEKNLRYALPIALRFWKEKGYRFATL